MRKTMKKGISFCLVALLLTGCTSVGDVPQFSGRSGRSLEIKDGMMQPILTYSDLRDPAYSNEESDILRYCVYVETDYDTDNDGKADLVKVFLQVPRGAAEGKYKAATIYDPTPYNAGTVDEFGGGAESAYLEKEFDLKSLYREGRKRTPEGEMDTLKAASLADPGRDWNYTVPVSYSEGYVYANDYDYYLVRGFAVAEASGIGTYGSEGFELCGTPIERDSHKCVVEWLAGKRKAYTDKEQNIEIKADWSNGNVAMSGCSYGGTLPFEVATTGVEGLKTIIPFAGIASWYDYTNSQGISTIQEVNYTDYLAAFNCGGVFLDQDWTVLNEDYRSWLWQISKEQAETNGNYAPIWAESDYTKDYANIRCSALIVHGLNDYNVTTRQADLMAQAFEKAGQPFKLVLHQNGHNVLYDYKINDEPWLEIQNKWLSHYLYDVDNGIENMAALTVQSNIDGTFRTYDSWRDFDYIEADVENAGDITDISSVGLAEYTDAFGKEQPAGGITAENQDQYYMGIPKNNAKIYDLDVPEGTTICGVPEVSVRLSSQNVDFDGEMITAILLDTMKDGELFKAYMLKSRINDNIPKRKTETLEQGGGLPDRELFEHVQDVTNTKCFSYGWTDLNNPGCGPDSSEYTEPEERRKAGQFYDYTFYMLPTVYTVDKGHQLKLLLTTWDAYRCFLDNGFELDLSLTERIAEHNYSFVVDNSSLKVMLPVK